MVYNKPGFPVHYFPEFAELHIHWVGNAIQPSHPLLFPSPPTFNLSQHQGLFKCQFFASGGQSTGVSISASVLPVNIQDWFLLGWTGWISLLSKGLSRVFSSTTVQKHQIRSDQISCSVMSDSLRSRESQHARPPCPSPTPRVYSNSCPLSWWCHPTISSSFVPFSSHLQSSPASGSFQMSVLCIRWPKYWSFSFSIRPSSGYSGLISFRMDWLDLLAVQGTLRVFSNITVQKHQFFGAQLSL